MQNARNAGRALDLPIEKPKPELSQAEVSTTPNGIIESSDHTILDFRLPILD
jgi:hypothetical protein